MSPSQPMRSEVAELQQLGRQLYEALAEGWPALSGRRSGITGAKGAAERRERAAAALVAFEAYEARLQERPPAKTAEEQRQYWREAQARHRSKPRDSQRVLAPCGTYAAYQRHRKHGEEACHECLMAQRAYRRDREKR